MMKTEPFSKYRIVLFVLVLIIFAAPACGPSEPGLRLAQFSENGVQVTVWLIKTSGGSYQLSARFTPPDRFHLYSKDLPRNGVDGLGRPTLLELPEDAKMQAAGPLEESVAAEIPSFEPKDLLVYPTGPVTLTLPVRLPADAEKFEDVVSLTFMACSDTGCKPPVVGKLAGVTIDTGQIP